MDYLDEGNMDDSIERYVDRDMTNGERESLELLMAETPDLQRQVALAFEIKRSLRTMPEPECPDHVVRAIYDATSRSGPLSMIRLAQPLAQAVAAACLLIALSLWMQPLDRPSDADVDQAVEDAKWALTFVSDMGRTSSQDNRTEILASGVVLPVQHALDYLFVGENNEQ